MSDLLIDQPIEKRIGNCFQCAAEYVLFRDRDATLVHAICFGTGGNAAGKWFAHAWVEFNGFAFDVSHDVCVGKKEFYAIGNVKSVKTYSYETLQRKLYASQHFGPWDKTILACKF